MNSHLKRVLILLLIFTFVFQMAGVTSLSRVQAYADTETEEALDVPDADEAEDVTTEEIDTESPGEIETDGENPPDATEEEPADPETLPEEAAEEPAETTADETVTVEETAEPAEAEAPMLKAAGTKAVNSNGKTVLAFTSDIHNNSNNVARNRMNSWIESIESNDSYGKIETFAFCGDMSAIEGESQFWTNTQSVMSAVDAKSIDGVYTTGNHEFSPGNYTQGKNDTTKEYIVSAEGKNGDNYRIYCIGTNNWNNSKDNFTQGQVDDLTEYLGKVKNDKPIFVLTHFPLHRYSSGYITRETTNAKLVIDALNNAVDAGKTIILLWGHNHSQKDPAYDQIYAPGYEITYASGKTEPIKFYYAAAGCMSDTEYTGSSSVKGKGMIVTIDDNSKAAGSTIELAYFNESGSKLTTNNSSATINFKAGSGDSGTTYTLTDKLEAGKEYLIASGNTGDVYIVSNETGTASQSLKGISATVSDGKITIDDEIAAKAAFTVELETNDENSIRLKNGETYLYSDSGDGLRMFALTSSQNTKWWHYNADDALLWFFKGTSNNYGYTDNSGTYKYYLTVNDNGEFVAGHTANSGSQTQLANCDTPDIYLFVKGDGSGSGGDDPTPTGETVDITPIASNSPEEYITIDVGETLTINVTNSSSRSGYDFTATLSNSGVAEVQGNSTVNIPASGTGQFTVKGLKDGNVDIVISNNNSSSERKGTIHLTVGDGSGDDPGEGDRYVPITYFIADKDYLIAVDKGNGKIDVLKNAGSGSLGSVELTVGSENGTDYVTTADSSLKWNYSTANDRTRLVNSSRYLTINSTSKALETDTSGNYDASYNNSKIELIYHNSTSGNIYYVKYNNGTFSATAANNASDGATIRLFVKDDGTIPQPVAVTGVTLDKSTLSLKAGQTDTLTATVEPEGATNKSVTWSTSDANVVTVANGTVTAVAAGTATITVTTADGGKTATCTVTVTAPIVDRYVKVDSIKAGGEYIITNNADVGADTTRALKNPGGTSSGVSISSSNGKTTVTILEGNIIETADTDIVWTATANGNGFNLSNNGSYLEVQSRALKVYNPLNQTSRYWTYTNNQLAHNGGSATYYVTYASGTFSSGTTAGNVYIFEKINGDTVAVTGVTLDKSTLSLEAGQTDTLTATVAPENATNNSVTWSTSDASIATVSDGTVTAVAAGTATITVTTADGGKTATCAVTVTGGDEPGEGATYYLADELEEGGEYLIANGNTGTVYVVSNTATGSGTSTGLVGISANVVDDSITLSASDAAKATFTAEMKTSQSGAISAWLKLDGKYLYTASSGGLRISNEQTTNSGSTNNTGKFWHYKADGKDLLWYFKDTSSSDGYTDTSNTYKYYLNCNSGTFTSANVSTTSLANTNTPKIYLFKKVTEKIDVTGVTLTPATATVEAGQTVELTATVTPADATNKGVTWTSSDETVATVSDGIVTGVAAGTATITVTTKDGGFTATCIVTVTAPTVDRYIKVDSIKAGGEYIITNNADVGADTTRALKNPGGTSSGNQITANNGKTTVTILEGNIIETADTDIVWKAEANGDGFNLTNDECYIEGSGGNSIKSYKPIKNADRYWTYSNEQLFHHNGTTSTYTANYASGTFTATTSSSTAKIYIFEKITDTPHTHTYGEPVYTWATDKSTCTATATCSGCEEGTEGHTVTETVNASSEVTTPATCVSPGVKTYTATFTNTLFTAKTETEAIEATGHTYGTPVYTWAADKSTCTATATCTVCGAGTEGHTVTETVNASSAITTPATCEDAGVKTYTATFTNTLFEAQTETEAIEATGHEWGTPTYAWGDNNATVTASRVCANDSTHVDSETVTTTSSVTKPATCTEKGQTTYTATFTNPAFAVQPKTVENIDALGHNPAEAVRENVVEATCTTAGGYDSVVYCTRCETELSRTHVDVEALGHDWNAPTYVWSDGNKTVTATRTCKRDAAHFETEISQTSYEVVTEATETTAGLGRYTAEFDNNAFETQIKEEVIQPTGYTVEYAWNKVGDGYKVTGTATPNAQGADPITETVDATYAVTTAPGCTEPGVGTWTATFTKSQFTVQTMPVDIPATGHDLTHHDAVEAQCEVAGNVEYWQCANCNKLFLDADGTTETTASDIVVPAKNHDWGTPSYVWAADNSSVTATRTCKNDATHKDSETVNTTYEVLIQPGDSTPGTGRYTATFTNPAFESQTSDVSIPATGYQISYVWADDNSSVTGTAVPYDTSAQTVKETVTPQYAVTTAATCETEGTGTWTATFTKAPLTNQTKEVTIPKAEHTLVATAAKDASCTEAGNSAYWTCSVCHRYFSDAQGNTEIQADSWVIPAAGHTLTAHAAKDASCTEAGNSAYWSCSVCGKYFSDAQGNTEIQADSWVIPAKGHNLTATAAKAATCTEAGNTAYYTCSVCHKYFSDAEGTDEIQADSWVIAAKGHNWGAPTYEWAADNSTVKATRVCGNDPAHTETETATTTSTTTAATCTAAGSTTYTATFNNSAFAAQNKTVEIPATGHTMTHHAAVPATCTDAGTVEYYSCSVCNKNFSDEAGRTELTTIVDPAKGHTGGTAVRENVVAATCETEGSYDEVVKCTVCGAEISRIHETTPALGHNWSEPVYVWADDYSSVTATRTCQRDTTHFETETAQRATYGVITPATETAAGVGRYTSAAFRNTAFTVQYIDVEIPPTGYEVSYKWADDNSSVTGTAKPYDTTGQTITETVAATYEETTAATCTTTGVGTWTSAAFTNSHFTVQKKTVDIPAKGHSLRHHAAAEPSCGVAGNTEYWQCENCGTIFGDEAGTQVKTASEVVIPALSHNYEAEVTKQPTCEETGVRTYTCSLCGDTYTEVIPANGHDWGEVQYTWASDNSKVTAKRTCATDPTHVETETVETTCEVLKQVTCEEDGKELYTSAAFKNEDFEVQKMEVVVSATGHKAGDPVHENEKAATCTSGGYYDEVVYCTECGKELSRVNHTVDALGHDFSEWTVIHEATCTEKGEEESTCSRCTAKNTRELPALGHSWDGGKVTKEPTYRTDGEMTYTCKTCGETYTEVIPKQGWKRDSNNNWNYIEPDGSKATGWKKVGDYWYYMDAAGIMQTGWTKVGNKWYYMNKNGAMQTGWQKISGKWYYFNKSGAMLTGWQDIGGKTYYFKSSGVMADKEWVTGYWWINAGGTWTYKYRASWEKTSDGHWMFKATNGWTAKNTTIIINDVSYTFDANGWMQ